MRSIPRPFATMVACAVGGFLVSGCDGAGPSGLGQADTLRVNIVTTGASPDSDGYVVKLGNAPDQPAAPNDTLVFTELTDGYYTLALSGLAPNCKVQGRNPVSVSIGGATATVTFEVSCEPFGAIRADVKTTGSLADTAAFRLVIQGSASQPVAPNGSALVTGLVAGNYAVALTDRPQRCSLIGPDLLRVTVAPGDTAHLSFEVTCADPGNLQVNVRTFGAPFADGYVLVLDGTLRRAIRVDDTVLFAHLDTGPHSIELEGLAGNCVISGPNPQTVTPVSGATVPLTMNVVCLRTGALEVGVHRTGMVGPGLPRTIVTLTGPGGFTQAGELGVFHLPPGHYQVTLRGAGIAFLMSCQVRGPNPQTVDVQVGTTAQAVFDVYCDFE